MNLLHLSVVSPEKKVLDIDCEQVSIPTVTGILTILPHHIALSTVLVPGEAEVVDQNHKKSFLVLTGGFATVADNTLTLLADFAIHDEEMDEEMVRLAKEKAEKAMEDHQSEESFANARAELLRATLQLKTVLKKKNR